MSTAAQSAVDIINHSHHRREPDPLLDLMADDAELVQYDMDKLGNPRRLKGKAEIEPLMRDVFSRDMTHEVDEVVVGEDRIAYMVHCQYPDGTRVVSSYMCELGPDGTITRMVGHVSWDAQ
jgi:hypothetical protein